MKTALPVVLLLICASGCRTNQTPTTGAAASHTGLEVRWKARKTPWPATHWEYRVEPAVFSPQVISNVLAITGYSTNEVTAQNANGMIFSRPNTAGSLSFSFPSGSIEYWTTVPFGHNNLAREVPEEKQLFQLTTNLIAQFGINSSELLRKEGSPQPWLSYIETQTIFTPPHATFITNITSREAHFIRVLDGVEFIGFGRGGNGRIEYGDHAKILQISLSWWNAKREKSYPTVTPKTLMRWIREGKVRPENPGTDAPPITSWEGVKKVTITHARLCCVGEPGKGWLRPFAALEANVEIGTNQFDVEINCPAIEAREPGGRKK